MLGSREIFSVPWKQDLREDLSLTCWQSISSISRLNQEDCTNVVLHLSEKGNSGIARAKFLEKGEANVDTKSNAQVVPEQEQPRERGEWPSCTKTSFSYKCLFMMKKIKIFHIEGFMCCL